MTKLFDKNCWVLSWYVMQRNWLVYRKNFIANISPTLAEPAFYLVALGLGLGGVVSSVKGHSYIEYLAPGLIVTAVLFTSYFEGSYGFYVRMNYERIFDAVLSTPVGVTEVVLGEFIWFALKGAFMAIGTSIVLASVGLMPHPEFLPAILLIGMGVAIPCGAIGLIASALVPNMHQFQTVYAFLISPLFFFSGLFFPISDLPVFAQIIVYIFPLAHGVELCQAFFWNEHILQAILIHGGALLLQSILLSAFTFWALGRKLLH